MAEGRKCRRIQRSINVGNRFVGSEVEGQTGLLVLGSLATDVAKQQHLAENFCPLGEHQSPPVVYVCAAMQEPRRGAAVRRRRRPLMLLEEGS